VKQLGPWIWCFPWPPRSVQCLQGPNAPSACFYLSCLARCFWVARFVQLRSFVRSRLFPYSHSLWVGSRGQHSLGLEIPHSQQQFQTVLLAPHQDGTKQGRRYKYSTDGPLSLECCQQGFPFFPGVFWTHGRNKAARISRFGRGLARHSDFYEFHSCALCRIVSRREFFAKILSSILSVITSHGSWP